MKNAIAVVVGGLLAFVWSTISWMIIPWHQPTMSVFENEEVVAEAIKAGAAEPGLYTYPGWTDDQEDMMKKHEKGPYVMASVVPDGLGGGMGKMMINGLLVSILAAAFLLVLMLMSGPDSNWKQRSLIAMVAGLFVSLIPALMNLNWWHFPVAFSVVAIIDGFITWTIAGVVIALIISRGSKAES